MDKSNQMSSDTQKQKASEKSNLNTLPYAQAAYELLKNTPDQLNQLLSLLTDFEQSISTNNLLKEVLSDPLTSLAFKKELIFKLIPGLANQEIFQKIVLVLASKKKIQVLLELGSCLSQIIDKANNVYEVQIVSTDADNKEVLAIENALKSISKRPLRVSTSINDSLVAGWIIKTPDFIIDNSVQERLRRMKTLVLSEQ